MTIVEFVNARLDEEERAAKAAADASGYDTWLSIGIEAGPDDDAKWTAIADRSWGIVAPHPEPPDDDTFYELGGELFRQRGSRGLTDHIARHDPARVLREVAAKRAVLALHQDAGMGDCAHSSDPCPTLRALAAPYVDHPDYDPAWAV
ncbi:DUF6221 family protein [Nocardiopsis sp. NPDC101807]|uniref:DUF6221 family protein n=1 Tax=Nocardiopsis sp. NPDC101807 TaxID=3364339 RepID=UPI00380A070A